MMPFLLLALALCALTVALLTRTLWWRGTARPSMPLVAGIAAFVLVVAGGGYAWLSASQQQQSAAVAAPKPGTAASSPDTAQIAALVEQLQQRLKAQPDDVDAWMMLARTEIVLGKHAEAVDAFKHADALHPDDPSLLSDYAYAVAMVNHRNLQGEPLKLLDRALQLSPNHPKALALSGMAAFDRRDYNGALKFWEQLARTQPDNGALAMQLQASIAEARRLGGVSAPVAATPSKASAAAGISGTVRLAPSLKAKASPEDTVFIFARAAEGPRMPLAILRKQVKDLPLSFTLDDSLSMSPAAKLSGATRVIVGARISKSGNAMPQPGDLQGLSAPVSVGANGLQIEISAEVPK